MVTPCRMVSAQRSENTPSSSRGPPSAPTTIPYGGQPGEHDHRCGTEEFGRRSVPRRHQRGEADRRAHQVGQRARTEPQHARAGEETGDTERETGQADRECVSGAGAVLCCRASARIVPPCPFPIGYPIGSGTAFEVAVDQYRPQPGLDRFAPADQRARAAARPPGPASSAPRIVWPNTARTVRVFPDRSQGETSSEGSER